MSITKTPVVGACVERRRNGHNSTSGTNPVLWGYYVGARSGERFGALDVAISRSANVDKFPGAHRWADPISVTSLCALSTFAERLIAASSAPNLSPDLAPT